MHYTRYAIYYTCPPGPLASFGAAWLGWDAARGENVTAPDVAGLPDAPHALTETPRKYGLHGTIKPPFRLAPDSTGDQLASAFHGLCTNSAPVTLDALALTRLGRFLALTPVGDVGALGALAASVVSQLDPFRAPPTKDDIARHRKASLTPTQEALLIRWGYPHVMGAFRFHMTLTGRLPDPALAQTKAALTPYLAPLLPRPFVIAGLTLCGEDPEGRFHEIRRAPLGG